MKKFRLLPLAAFILAIAASAFTLPSKAVAPSASGLYWFVDPSDPNSYQGQNTKPDEQLATGCSSTNSVCEKGYTSSQLVTPGHPEDGVLSSQINNGEIIRQP